MSAFDLELAQYVYRFGIDIHVPLSPTMSHLVFMIMSMIFCNNRKMKNSILTTTRTRLCFRIQKMKYKTAMHGSASATIFIFSKAPAKLHE